MSRHKFFSIADFAYNNIKNANISHMPFKLNFGFNLYIIYKKNFDPHLKSKTA